jgi:hypothetical protein
MRFVPKRESIADLGLEKWLDKYYADKGGYARFVEMLDSPLDYTKPQLAIEFGVTKDTIYSWIEQYEKERANAK